MYIAFSQNATKGEINQCQKSPVFNFLLISWHISSGWEKKEKKKKYNSFRFYLLGCKIKATLSKVQILSDNFETRLNAVK